ncbi:uncharacterized protein WM294_005762 [Sarcoramphus papa]
MSSLSPASCNLEEKIRGLRLTCGVPERQGSTRGVLRPRQPCAGERRLQPPEAIVALPSSLTCLQVHAFPAAFITFFPPRRVCTSLICTVLFCTFFFTFFFFFVYASETNEICFCLLESMLYFPIVEHLVFVKGTTKSFQQKISQLECAWPGVHVCHDLYPKKDEVKDWVLS